VLEQESQLGGRRWFGESSSRRRRLRKAQLQTGGSLKTAMLDSEGADDEPDELEFDGEDGYSVDGRTRQSQPVGRPLRWVERECLHT
jgi:hypothetical protein